MIILITGAPATGKTTLASQLSQKWGLPQISRDLLQEWIFESIQTHSKEIYPAISNAGYELMFKLAGQLANGTGSYIIEGCINPELGGTRLLELTNGKGHPIYEIFLKARKDILISRYHARAMSTPRHPAHNDLEKSKNIEKHLNEVVYAPLRIGELLEIDTSDEPEKAFEKAFTALERLFK